jgi:hypothetical protein
LVENDPALEALWKRVLDAWDDDAPHNAFLDYCRTRDRLVEAAVRYRGMAGDHARAAVAAKKLKAVLLLAMTRLEASRSEPPSSRRHRGAYALMLFFVIATAGLVAYVARTP